MGNYDQCNAPKYGVTTIKTTKPYTYQQYSDFDKFVMTLMVLRIIHLPPDFQKL